jgi:hypothetical protein
MYIALMKASFPYLLIAVIFFVIIIYSAFVSSNPIKPTGGPFHPSIKPHEGFTSRYHSLEYTNSNGHMDSYTSNLMNQSPEICRKLYGFDGLVCGPDQSEKIDIFTGAQGSLECAGSGLTNSKGSLCLDKNMTHLLGTRGGNSTGRDSQIGG